MKSKLPRSLSGRIRLTGTFDYRRLRRYQKRVRGYGNSKPGPQFSPSSGLSRSDAPWVSLARSTG